MIHRYALRVAPGCHGGPDPLGCVISRHSTIELAERAARRSDRLVVVAIDDGVAGDEILYQIPPQGSRHGAGRFGGFLAGCVSDCVEG